jgi:hypothetical protein
MPHAGTVCGRYRRGPRPRAGDETLEAGSGIEPLYGDLQSPA